MQSGPESFWIDSPSLLVIVYHWLALLNQVRKNLLSPNSLQILSTKLTISQKLNIAKKNSVTKKSVSKDCTSFGAKKKFSQLVLKQKVLAEFF